MSKDLEWKLNDIRGLINEIYENETDKEVLKSRDCFRQYLTEIETELKKGEKFVKLIREMYANGVGIDKVFDDIRHSDSYEDFTETYPYCPKDWFDLLKEVLL